MRLAPCLIVRPHRNPSLRQSRASLQILNLHFHSSFHIATATGSSFAGTHYSCLQKLDSDDRLSLESLNFHLCFTHKIFEGYEALNMSLVFSQPTNKDRDRDLRSGQNLVVCISCPCRRMNPHDLYTLFHIFKGGGKSAVQVTEHGCKEYSVHVSTSSHYPEMKPKYPGYEN